jgi:hypothetical protein
MAVGVGLPVGAPEPVANLATKPTCHAKEKASNEEGRQKTICTL